MKIEMYLDGKLVDTTELISGEVQSDKYFRIRVEHLLVKHRVLIADSENEPSFLLCGLHSSMKYFVPDVKKISS
jgi:hypothetical protein